MQKSVWLVFVFVFVAAGLILGLSFHPLGYILAGVGVIIAAVALLGTTGAKGPR